jgi:hypothetical protein
MTDPGGISFVDESVDTGTSLDESVAQQNMLAVPGTGEDGRLKFPPPVLDLGQDKIDSFIIWMDDWLQTLISDNLAKQKEWSDQEESYRAKPQAPKVKPFAGAANHVVPVIAMAVDPIHARLDTGIFKQDPVFKLKALKRSSVKYSNALEAWINYYQKNKLKLRQVASPRLLELTKLGTCVFKTVYDRQAARIKTYKTSDNSWDVVDRVETRFSGPRVFGISIGDFLFPPLYQHLQDCPIVAERQRTTYWKLKVAEASGKLKNVDALKGQEITTRTQLETSREDASSHTTTHRYHDELEIYEVWCDYDIDGNGLPEHLVATYHRDTRTLLQLRYNWYFHQRKPYTVIPYQLTNDSLYGMGICEMVKPFQDAITLWDQTASNNAYIANIRMFIVKRESGIEEVPRLYAGRCFFVDDPRSDFIPFAAGDVYPSTLAERQNLFGLTEKRTGVSDYLSGRESPIIGSRATATSTLALIQEGTKRVEEVLENIRVGMAELIENCIYIWIQYGLEGLDDLVFGDDEIGQLVGEFFANAKAENVNGSLAIDLTATDASGNRQAMQQMQLQIINVMMVYLEKLLQSGQAAMQLQGQMPQFTLMVADVMTAARRMFNDLLQKYDIRNPQDYLPDLEKYLQGGTNGQPGQVPGGGAEGPTGGNGAIPTVPGAPPAYRGPTPPGPATPGVGTGVQQLLAAAGANSGAPSGY